MCLHSLGFKDSTTNTHVFCVSQKMEKNFFYTRVSLSLQKEDSRLCDVNDAYFKEEEDEDKEEEDTCCRRVFFFDDGFRLFGG